MQKEIPDFKPGDYVRIHYKVVEGEAERIQIFEGVVIGRRGGGISETFAVRKISFGVGVERTFPLHSPRIEKMELTIRGKVRRAKLYYLRHRTRRVTRLEEEKGKTRPSEQKAAPTQPAEVAKS